MGKDVNSFGTRINGLVDGFGEVRASLNVLFLETVNGRFQPVDVDRKDFIAEFSAVVDSVTGDLRILDATRSSASRLRIAFGGNADSIDHINTLIRNCAGISLVKKIESAVMDVLIASGLFGCDAGKSTDKSELIFALSHAQRLCRAGDLFIEYLDLLEAMEPSGDGVFLSRVHPGARERFSGCPDIGLADGAVTPETLALLERKAVETDPFAEGTAFRYLDHEFYPADLNSIRKPKDFYGYHEVRKIFQAHFESFARGESNLPLLISSLPGLGKTHFAISYTLALKGLILILPEPEDIERGLEPMIRRLANRKNHKFVLFFDDIDTRTVNWYYFRTNVGGSFMLPANINIVIASNFEFPANISSRGRGVTFPMFDEINCQGMIADFLSGMGMRKVHNNLVAVIAADYVAEFGQRKFEELSPRTLVRYLERYRSDAAKRRKMLKLSQEELISTPDPQVFFEFNVRLMKMLYGEDSIERLRTRYSDGQS